MIIIKLLSTHHHIISLIRPTKEIKSKIIQKHKTNTNQNPNNKIITPITSTSQSIQIHKLELRFLLLLSTYDMRSSSDIYYILWILTLGFYTVLLLFGVGLGLGWGCECWGCWLGEVGCWVLGVEHCVWVFIYFFDFGYYG